MIKIKIKAIWDFSWRDRRTVIILEDWNHQPHKLLKKQLFKKKIIIIFSLRAALDVKIQVKVI